MGWCIWKEVAGQEGLEPPTFGFGDLIVTLIPAKDQEELDRLGLEREGLDVLGEKVLHVQLSVAPGRDIARLVEVAAMDYHLKDMGIDMAGEFNRRLMSNFQSSEN